MNKQLTSYEIEEFLRHWNEQNKLNNKSFDDLFKLYNKPLWWFYYRYFEEISLPKPINTFNHIKNKNKISLIKKINYYFKSYILKTYFKLNENLKIRIQKKEMKNEKNSNLINVLLLSYPKHIDEKGDIFRIQSLINTMKENKLLNPITIFADPISNSFMNSNKKLHTIYNYYDKNISLKSNILSKKLYDRWNKISSKHKEQMLMFNNLSLFEYLKYSFKFFLSKEFIYYTILYVELFKKILKQNNIQSVIITGQSSIFERCLIIACKENNLPVYHILHGVLTDNKTTDPIDEIYYLVFNSEQKKGFIESNINKNRIRIVGPLIFEEINKIKKKKKRKENSILICTSTLIEDNLLSKKEYFDSIKNILTELLKISDVKISIKLHPREKYLNKYKQIINKLDKHKINLYDGSLSRKSLYELMSQHKFFIHFGSTSAIEAILLDSNVINLVLSKKLKKFLLGWLDNYNIGPTVNIGDNLSNIIKHYCYKKYSTDKNKFIKNICGKKIDSSKIIINLINKNIKKMK